MLGFGFGDEFAVTLLLYGSGASLIGYALVGRFWGGLALVVAVLLAGYVPAWEGIEVAAEIAGPFVFLEFPLLWWFERSLKQKGVTVGAWPRVALGLAGAVALWLASHM